MHTGVRDKFTNVRYCLSDALMVDLFLLPPTLCFLELPPAVVEFVALHVTTDIPLVSTRVAVWIALQVLILAPI